MVGSNLTQHDYQPAELKGNIYLGNSSLSISESWSNATIGLPIDPYGFFYPEFLNQYSDSNVKAQSQEYARRILVDS
jgi:hypothetical protein